MRGLTLHRVGCRRAWSPTLPRRCLLSTSPPQRSGEQLQQSFQEKLVGLTPKWQPFWESNESRLPQLRKDGREKAYILPMFPYPSGTMHLGHLRVYTISDVLARFKQMQGYDVLHPIGWDAFGLPAENAAIERGVHPATWTLQNIDAMKEQMKQMGGQWSWDRANQEIRTCDPAFYKHTQRLFLMLFERGLAYQAESLVNWDPVDQTVLANEQVDANGISWRSGAKVEKKMLKQWFLKIKEFQEPLLKDMEELAKNGRWPERVLAMQKNWIGRSEGTKLSFDIGPATNNAIDAEHTPQLESVEVYTTRADTLFGVMYVALSLNHPIVQRLAEDDVALQEFLDRASNFPPDSKEGLQLPGLRARNPIADLVDDKDIDKYLPVFVAPYVLDDYGSGAVMGVPAHDARDHAFWRQNKDDLPLRHVIRPNRNFSKDDVTLTEDKPLLDKGFLSSTDRNFDCLSSDQAIKKITERLQQAGKLAEQTEKWRLRDWLISRQRYWGCPIPIIHCSSCGPVPEEERALPVELPNLPASFFKGQKGNPLAEDENFKKTTCPKCHKPAERETDTMDTFMDSSWYFFRFLDPLNDKELVDPVKVGEGMPVDVYIGGVEHAILHLLYARFISKFLATTPLWPHGKEALGEPFNRLITQGMVHGKTYTHPETGRFLRPEEVDLSNPLKPIIKGISGDLNESRVSPKVSYEKMSKSKYNGVDPGTTIATYGVDVTRAHMLFQAPVSDVLEWDEQKITGVQRWLGRVLRLSTAFWYPAEEAAKYKPLDNLDANVTTILHHLEAQGILNSKSTTQAAETDEQRLINGLEHAEMFLLSKTQETIAAVTKAYTETFSLNTVVSDLMTLTNTIWDTPHTSIRTSWLKWYATIHLLRMVAPIAPGVAEEGWHELISRTNQQIHSDSHHPLSDYINSKTGSGPSILSFGFPTADLAIVPKLNPTANCVVQFNGKKKFEVKIPKAPVGIRTADQSLYLLDELLKTTEGKKYLAKETGVIWKESGTQEPDLRHEQIPRGWSMIVVKDGKLVNFVAPKAPKAKSERKKT
ncbi:hypothetical protein N0V90_012274 [Kalmusia sp. IMI 367209]|nr:hypothetical protein N0V90_012274 [Kalmusia sp. IMI 367209]